MTISTFQRIYQEYLHSRLSVRDLCANQGFAPSTFYYWKKQLGATRQAEPDCFVPLLLDAGPTETEGQHSYVPATSSGNKTGGVSNAPIEFVFLNGTKMVIRDHADIHLLKTIAYSIYEQKKGVLLLGSGRMHAVNFIKASRKTRTELSTHWSKLVNSIRLSKALSYTYNLFERLSRYHLDGRYLPDNNLAENAIRPLAVGRKGYLFCGNHDAAENAAIMYSLLGCYKASDVSPREWLTDVFSKIASYNANYNLDLSDLLPHIWKKSNKCQGFPKDSD